MRFLILLTIIFTLNTYASIGLNSCGEFEFRGVPQIDDKEMIVVINNKSKSEIRILIPLSEQSRITPYLKHTVEGKIKISKIKNLWRGEAIELKDIRLIVPDPLNPSINSFLKIIKSKKCQ